MKIVVMDNGLYAMQAEALAEGGKNEVIYWTPWAKPFPTVDDYAKGYGYGKMKKEIWLFNHILDADMIVNFDVSNNDLIHYLKQVHPEKSIFGAGLGEKLEHDRVFFKKWLEHFKLPVGPYKVIQGLGNLRKYLEHNPNRFVKTNIFRDDMESFFFGKWEDDKYLLDEKAVTLGSLIDDYNFIVEEPIECACELGYDGFYGNGKYIPFSWGPEIAKNLYVGKVISDIDELPDCLANTLDTISPLLNRMDYRGALSTEERVITTQESYFIDFCARIPAPLGQIYPMAIKNWAELVYKVGKNEDVKIECDHAYVGAYALSSEHAATHNVKMLVKEKDLDSVRFQVVAKNKDGYFAVKGTTAVCVLVAGGDSPDEVIDKIKDAKKLVDAYGLEKDPVDGIDDQFQKALEGMESINIEF